MGLVFFVVVLLLLFYFGLVLFDRGLLFFDGFRFEFGFGL